MTKQNSQRLEKRRKYPFSCYKVWYVIVHNNGEETRVSDINVSPTWAMGGVIETIARKESYHPWRFYKLAKVYKNKQSFECRDYIEPLRRLFNIKTCQENPIYILADLYTKYDVWYLIVNSDGTPYNGSQVGHFLASWTDIFNIDVLKTEILKYTNLKSEAYNMRIYNGKIGFERKQEEGCLEAIEVMNEVQSSKDDPLYVLVPKAFDDTFEREVTLSISPVMDSTNNLFELPRDYLKDSGFADNCNRFLYRRQNFKDQFKFLKEQVLENGCIGWILGSSGSGKSITTVAFLSTLDKQEWAVTWVKFLHSDPIVVVQYYGDEKTNHYHYCRYTFLNVLLSIGRSNKHILIIDGILNFDHYKLSAFEKCIGWLNEKKEKRRLVLVNAYARQVEKMLKLTEHLDVQYFNVTSWELDEYYQAVKHDALFESVKDNLDATQTLDGNRLELVTSKYYYAGGSVRFMFDRNTADVVNLINECVPTRTKTKNFQSYLYQLKTNLSLSKGQDGENILGIISHCTAYTIGLKSELEAVNEFFKTVEFSHQVEGPKRYWYLEMWMLLRIRHCSFWLQNINGRNVFWRKATLVQFRSLSDLPKSIFAIGPIWLQPIDCRGRQESIGIYLDTLGLVRFVFLTCQDRNILDLHLLSTFIQALEYHSLTIKRIEIVYVIDEIISTFRITTVLGQGSLSMFRGWNNGQELQNVQVVVAQPAE